MRVVIDANILISAVISKNDQSPPKQLYRLWRKRAFEVAITEEILSEIERVLKYPHLVKLHQWGDHEIAKFIKILSRKSVIVKPDFRLSVSSDETDNRYIECAVESGARYVISGDKKHLLSITEYSGIKFISAAAFATLMKTAEKLYA